MTTQELINALRADGNFPYSLAVAEKLESLSKELEDLKNSLEVVAYARKNSRGGLFDLRLQNNPFVDQNTVEPLYRIKSNDRQEKTV